MTTPTRSCPACKSQRYSETEYSKAEWKVVSCEQCSFVYLNNPPEYEELEEDFAFEKTFAIESQRRVESEPLFSALSKFMKSLKYFLFKRDKPLHLLSQYVQDGGEIVDVGSGNGRKFARSIQLLQEQKNINLTPLALEISLASAKLAESNLAPLGGRCIQNNAVDGLKELPESQTDCVQMRAFLEHEVNPAGLLDEAYRVLKPGGVTIIKVPNFACINRHVRQGRWCGFRYPDHVNYFTPDSLKVMLTNSGFKIARMSLLDRFPLNDNMYIVGIKSTKAH